MPPDSRTTPSLDWQSAVIAACSEAFEHLRQIILNCKSLSRAFPIAWK